eukprot:18725_1
MQECDKYVEKIRNETYKLQISFGDIEKVWRHLVISHLVYNDRETYKYFVQQSECSSIYCDSLTRNSQRAIGNTNILMSAERRNTYNEQIQRNILADHYYQSIFDSIHCNIFHPTQQRNQITRVRHASIAFGLSVKHHLNSVDKHISHTISLLESDDQQFDTTLIEMTDLNENGEHKQHNNEMYNVIGDDYSRYISDLGLYGFGITHKHEELGPHHENTCFKEELINSGYLNEEQWENLLNKAIHKFECISNILSKQFNSDYNICRGDYLNVHHILSVCAYTDKSKLCTDYRSSFRRITRHESDESIRKRFSKFYFLSRFLYECIEFWGSIMGTDTRVYHGLNNLFLFSRFATNFNAPTSTTQEWSVANSFSEEKGIIMELINGNKEIRNDIVALFSHDQPRYLDVSLLSSFSNESELLYFGDNIIFEIHNIWYHNKNGEAKSLQFELYQLHLLERIIKNQQIDWSLERKKK